MSVGLRRSAPRRGVNAFVSLGVAGLLLLVCVGLQGAYGHSITSAASCVSEGKRGLAGSREDESAAKRKRYDVGYVNAYTEPPDGPSTHALLDDSEARIEELWEAARGGNEDAVRKLLAEGADVNGRDPEKLETALHAVCSPPTARAGLLRAAAECSDGARAACPGGRLRAEATRAPRCSWWPPARPQRPSTTLGARHCTSRAARGTQASRRRSSASAATRTHLAVCHRPPHSNPRAPPPPPGPPHPPHPRPTPAPSPPSRTDWTSLVPPPVLTGHVSSLLPY